MKVVFDPFYQSRKPVGRLYSYDRSSGEIPSHADIEDGISEWIDNIVCAKKWGDEFLLGFMANQALSLLNSALGEETCHVYTMVLARAVRMLQERIQSLAKEVSQ